ncbi:DUF3194 domain-containing protein [Halococcus saccharolyticus]|uniref:DUF3194 domain-containing protein n=1 Tax=Halococcus saccharolyticus DSM 5350 TaxID=1227455 RepID=M0MMV7_9EURY|nr:DUF3194 domain-containing protein [Halococcus saccharolyticus]EMA46713.1 hypothetical protein C449_03566 [Halococcus saccharolyticus DSM 5350]
MPTDDEVVATASEAAEGMIFSRYKRSAVRDLDITVGFEDGILDIDIYLNPPDDADPDPEAVVEEAIQAAESAVDELFADE